MGKREAFDKGHLQLIDEGAIQMLRSIDREGDLIFAALGKLQFEDMQYRLRDEYEVDRTVTLSPYKCRAWVLGDTKTFKKLSSSIIVQDRQDRPMAQFANQWEKQYIIKQNPKLEFVDVLA